ncbi:MAG: bleomycin resistance protein [Bacillota bacterium]
MIDLVPELLVINIEKSLIFWCDTCLFQIRYERLEEGFAYIEKRNAQLMLEEIGRSRNWITDELTYPFGRGINFQIDVDSIALIYDNLYTQNYPIFMEPEVKWYRKTDVEVGVKQFLVQDPDGYLIRFSEYLGERAIVL